MGDNVTLPYQDDSDRQSSARPLRNAPEKCDDSATLFATPHYGLRAGKSALESFSMSRSDPLSERPPRRGLWKSENDFCARRRAAVVKRARWAIKPHCIASVSSSAALLTAAVMPFSFFFVAFTMIRARFSFVTEKSYFSGLPKQRLGRD